MGPEYWYFSRPVEYGSLCLMPLEASCRCRDRSSLGGALPGACRLKLPRAFGSYGHVLYFYLLYSTLLDSTRLDSTRLDSTPLYSILLYSTRLYSTTLLDATRLASTRRHYTIQYYAILCHTVLYYAGGYEFWPAYNCRIPTQTHSWTRTPVNE